MALYTRIRGEQINLNDAGIDLTADHIAFNDATDDVVKMESADDLVTALAGVGLANSSSTLALDLNELGAGVVDVSADSIAIVDADDNGSKKEAIADVVTAIAGTGLSASAGVLAVDLNELTEDAIDVANDYIPFIDVTDNGSNKESVADLITAIAGTGLQASSGVLALDFNELGEVAVDVSADYITIEDATDNSSKKESIADLVTAMAGSGLTATNGVLSVDSITDNVVETDFAVEDESGNCNGAQTDFTLDSTPIANSVQVFLNGQYQTEGSGKDYTLSGTTVSFTTAPLTGDILVIHYVINN